MKKILILIILLSLLVSCQTEEAKEELTFRITWKAYSGRGEAIQSIVDVFNATEEDYHITVVSGDEDLQLIEESLENKTHDIYVLPYRYIKHFGEAYLMAQTPPTEDVFYDSLLDMGQVNKKQYGIPWVSHSMALIYNKTLLDQLSINALQIKSKVDFLDVLEDINNKSQVAGIGLVGQEHNDLSWMVNQFITGQGGLLVEDNKVALNSPSALSGLEYYLALKPYAQEDFINHNGGDVMKLFREGQVAFEIQSIWGITEIWKHNNPFEIGVIPLNEIGLASEVGPKMLTYSKETENQEVIDRFIGFMISKEAQKMILKGEYSPEKNEYYPFRLPIRKDVIDEDYRQKYGVFQVFLDSYEFASIDVPTEKWMSVKNQIYTPLLHKLLNETIDLEEFIEELEKQANEILGGKDE